MWAGGGARMIPKSNVHSHTTYADGRNTAEEMAEAALRLGFHTLGFSEHGHADYDDCSMAAAREADYRSEVLALRARYAGRLAILLGYEHDWLAPADLSPYDYVIESVHYVPAGGELFCVDHTPEILAEAVRRHFGGDWYAMCRAYFGVVCESCARTRADILGHIELVMKFNEDRSRFDDADPRYLKCALEAADCAADSGRLVEINTGAIARGWRTRPYPGEAMLRRLAERGTRVIITSDCHDARYLDCGFADAVALAKACGFRTAWQYRGNLLEEYPL